MNEIWRRYGEIWRKSRKCKRMRIWRVRKFGRNFDFSSPRWKIANFRKIWNIEEWSANSSIMSHLASHDSPAAYMFEGAGEPGIFSVPEPRGKLVIFLSPMAYMERERSEFFQFPGPIFFTCSFIFLHISSYILHIFLIFLHVSSYFLYIYYIKEFPNVTSSGVAGGGCTRKSWYYLAGHKTWNMSKE